MDQGGPVRRPGMDITPPGGTAAAPSSKPVITNSHPYTPDPMMSTRPRTFDMPTTTPTPPTPEPAPVQAPAPPEQPKSEPINQSIPEVKVDAKLSVPSQNTFEPLHKLKHEEPFFGHVGKHKKSKVLILLIVVALTVISAVGYFFLVKAK